MLVSKNFSDLVTLTRASAAWSFSAGGVLTQAAANVPRLDYDPITRAARGLLIEEQRVNVIRNNSMVGAVAGAPGTMPTNWNVGGFAGLTRQITAVGVEDGIPYFEVRMSGTTGDTVGAFFVDPTPTVAGANGQVWSQSTFCVLVAGSLSGISIKHGLYQHDAAQAYLSTVNGPNFVPPSGGKLSAAWRSDAITANRPETAYLRYGLVASYANGATVDFTLRIGAPQFELGTFATSTILTTGAQVTRAVDSAIITDLSKIGFNPSEGTVVIGGECYNANAVQQGGSSPRLMVLYSSANSNENMSMYRSSAGNQAGASITTGGAGYPVVGPVIPSGSKFKLAFAYKSGDNALCLNGAVVNTLGQMTLPSGIDRMSIGSYGGSSGSWSGWLTSVNYIPQRAINSKLQTLTT
ncbi:hypothetical protein K2O51_23290 [Cupriavidus pinatubonensis]|uniref:phage head spike fiber domain-containing protein n=1 Tax=Cupriavidus pinatubonensis TaxID=248026 RepID=UPI001C733F6A|nr:hypothetical protein [Cupriavidus pinatubonensis]QYY30297.1 hypothetical protein K2O51_23290 [Cupriavidus pinatubonensis]